MLTYDLRLMRRNKTFPEKFCLALDFKGETEFSDQYKAVRKLNLNASYSKTKFAFYITPTVDNVVGLIRLRAGGATLNITDDARVVFESYREKALAEIQIRNQEAAYIAKLKAYGKLNPVTVKTVNGRSTLYNHQKFLYLLATHVRKSAYWCDPGTGKTAPALLSAARRIELGQVKKCLVVVPANLLYKWAEGEGNEINKHTFLDGMVLDGDKPTRIAKIKRFLKDPTKQFIITSYNFWSGRRIGRSENRNDEEYNLLLNSGRIQMFICDESHRFKNTTALVTKNILKYFPSCEYGIILSGTPQPRSMLDIFTQKKLVDHTVFGHDFYAFQNRYFIATDPFKSKWKIKSKRHKDVLMSRSEARAMVYSVEECLDLPQEINETVHIYQNDDYLRELRRMSASTIREAMDSGDKGKGMLSKLLIATCGFTYQRDALGNITAKEFKTNPKIDALETLVTNIAEAGKKSIIWHMWRYDPVIIKRLLDKLGYKYIHIARKDTKKERYEKAKLYDKSEDVPFLIASPRHISEGFDIYTPGYAIYYSYDFDFLPLVQSKARNRRMGSSDYHSAITYYYLCVKDSVEEDVLLALKEKKSIKDALFGACKNILNRISKFRSKK